MSRTCPSATGQNWPILDTTGRWYDDYRRLKKLVESSTRVFAVALATDSGAHLLVETAISECTADIADMIVGNCGIFTLTSFINHKEHSCDFD